MLSFRNGLSNLSIVILSNLLVFFTAPILIAGQTDSKNSQAGGSASVAVSASEALSTSAPATGNVSVKKEDQTPSDPANAKSGEKKKTDEFDQEAWRQRYRKYNTWYGPTGGILLIDPTSGAPGSARLQLLIDDFSDSDFLYKNDSVDQVGQTLSFGWTATELLELYGSLRYVGTVSKRTDPDTDEKIKQDKHVMGDLRVGMKVGAPVTPLLSLGGDIGFYLPNQAGATGPLLNSMSVQLRFGLESDLRNLENKIPLILRLNLSYLIDNSSALIKALEDARYDRLANAEDDRLPRKYERRHFVSRFDRFAININREDQILFALGVEAPVEVATEWYLHPIVEWQIGIPVNRQGFVCPDYWTFDKAAGVPFTDDRCQYNRGAKVYPNALTAGLRAVPPIRGLSALLGVDIGLTGTGKFVRELVPVAPYRVLIAVGYDYDARPPEVRVVEKTVKVTGAQGRIKGVVLKQGTNEPLPGAAVSFIGRDVSALQTNQEGKFVSYPFAPGIVEMEISHPDLQRSGCSANLLQNGSDVEVTCYALPQPAAGAQLSATVVDQWGTAVAGAKVELSGPETATINSDASGQFQKQVAPGEYRVTVDAPGYLVHSATVTVSPRQTTTARFALIARPAKTTLEVKNNEIRFTEPLKFANGSTDISSESTPVVVELADLLQRSSYIRRIKIWGSTAGAKEEVNLALLRALSIKRRLVDAGIAPDRIDAVAGDSPKVRITVEN